MSDWMELCRQALDDDPRWRVLTAFDRGDTSVGCGGFPALHQRCLREVTPLARRIQQVLSREVDRAQAALFARRFLGVKAILIGMNGPMARVLLVGLVRRTTEVLSAPAPRALRIRAVADYFYSQAAVLFHAKGGRRTFPEAVSSISWRPLDRGLSHGHLVGPGPMGPLNINLLVVENRRLHMLDPRPQTDLVALVHQHGAIAGLSGGFFLYSEPDIEPPSHRTDPVGLLVTEGKVKNPPIFHRGSLLQHENGEVEIRRVGLKGCRLHWDSQQAEIVAVNEGGPGCRAWTRAVHHVAPEPGWQVVGTRVIGEGRSIPLGGMVLTGIELRNGAVLEVRLPTPVRAAMAGGPILSAPFGPVRELLHEDFSGTAPPITFSKDETYDQYLLPRMGVGLRRDGRVVFAAVDGRNLHRAPGLTLAGTADLLQALGCHTSLNLDGGSSKRMVVEGRVVDLTSTEVMARDAPSPIRPVHSAILIC